ncbi:MAG: hypothetical protein KGZ63_14760 [Clostridiales bacterium]|jgi:hypothetical protein|nr:hypothetical protein [Clostridiales bacterium]
MTGVEAFNFILNYFSIVNSHWQIALDGFVVDEVPDCRYLEVSGARISWSEKVDPLFFNDTPDANLSFAQLFKANCSLDTTTRIKFERGASTVAILYPNCIDWFDDPNVREFFLHNLPILISDDNITDSIELDSVVNKISFLAFESQFIQDAEYNALKFGYVFSLGSCSPWNKDYLALPTSVPFVELKCPDLIEFFRLGLATADPFHQFLEFYHLLEFRFYEALYQRLTVLRNTNAKQFFKEVRKGNYVTELKMFEYVLEELANGFTGLLNVTGITTSYSGSVSLFGPLDALNKNTWCDYLYNIRCGIVHSKEGEPIFERTIDNENLLCDYLLPFMRDLCIYLLESDIS